MNWTAIGVLVVIFQVGILGQTSGNVLYDEYNNPIETSQPKQDAQISVDDFLSNVQRIRADLVKMVNYTERIKLFFLEVPPMLDAMQIPNDQPYEACEFVDSTELGKIESSIKSMRMIFTKPLDEWKRNVTKEAALIKASADYVKDIYKIKIDICQLSKEENCHANVENWVEETLNTYAQKANELGNKIEEAPTILLECHNKIKNFENSVNNVYERIRKNYICCLNKRRSIFDSACQENDLVEMPLLK